jgi:hypothetical protein
MTRALDNERIDLDRFLKVCQTSLMVSSNLIPVYTVTRKGAVHEAGVDRTDLAWHGAISRVVVAVKSGEVLVVSTCISHTGPSPLSVALHRIQ